MDLLKVAKVIGLGILGGVFAALGGRVILNAIDGKPLLEAPQNPVNVMFALPEGSKPAEEPKKDEKKK